MSEAKRGIGCERWYTPELDAEIYAALTGRVPRLAALPPSRVSKL